MATDAAFANVPRVGMANPSATANNSFSSWANAVDLITGVAAGTVINRITVVGSGTPTIAGGLCILLNLSGTQKMIDEFIISALTGSATVATYWDSRSYSDLILPDANAKLQIASRVASQLVTAFAFGADLT